VKKTIISLVIVLALVLGIRASTDEPYGPVVVKKVSLLAQNSSSGTVTLYTPASDGDYAIYLNGFASSNTGNSDFRVDFTWTDELMSEFSQRLTGPGGTGTGVNNDAFFIRATAGNPIQYSTVYNAGTSNLSYDVYITLVKQ
jgi:hypothetical protein